MTSSTDMSEAQGLLDTSYFVARESGRPHSSDRVPTDCAVSIVTIAELRLGVLTSRSASARSLRLSTFLYASDLDPLPVDGEVAEAWAQLRITLRDTKTKMSVNDSWIAATAMAHAIPVITQNGGFVEGLGFDIVRI
ncbi:MAG: type II toxin-antitoxin system VapC family toxin [Acidimicrobiia bacterium]|nr:type II toxin-antitoxin system VapC family toxin [Acidimicrobiia bacterium]